jgi:hypothetical protein
MDGVAHRPLEWMQLVSNIYFRKSYTPLLAHCCCTGHLLRWHCPNTKREYITL